MSGSALERFSVWLTEVQFCKLNRAGLHAEKRLGGSTTAAAASYAFTIIENRSA
jgi:hypothetical protein